MLDEVGGDTVGELHERAQGVLVACGIEALGGFDALHGQVPGGHVPTDGKQLFLRDFEPCPECHHGRFLAVAHGEVAIVDIVAVDLDPDSRLVFFLLACGAVDVGFADVVKQRGDDHAVALELVLEFGSFGNGEFAQFECRVAHIERVLKQSAVAVQVMVDACGGGEKVVASLVEVVDEVIDAFASGGAQQFDEFLLFEFYCRVHSGFRVFDASKLAVEGLEFRV